MAKRSKGKIALKSKAIRLTVRPKTYRGEAGFTVKGDRTDIFFNNEYQAREYVKRIKAGEQPDDVLADIWGIKKGIRRYSISELRNIHEKRNPLSRASDERQKHQVTIEANSPKVKGWVVDPGRADVKGIDTPSAKNIEKRMRNAEIELGGGMVKHRRTKRTKIKF